MEYLVVKVASGEEVIGRVADSSGNTVGLENPAVVVIDHQKSQMYLVPFMPFLSGPVTVEKTCWGYPDKSVQDQYVSKFFPNDLIVPEKTLILPGK